MSPHEPQKHDQEASKRAALRGRNLRNLPGFTTAAVAFVVVVLMGGGGIAVAKWNQSATATINITAGAAPTPTLPPAPTPVPTSSPTPAPAPTLPQTGTGNIVAAPVMDIRPSGMNADQITCASIKDAAQATKDATAGFVFSWAPAINSTSYVTSLTFSGKGYSYQQKQSVTGNQALYTLNNSPAAFGLYILRIQPMNGVVAGDPIYRTFQHSAQLSANCYDARPDGKSLLGTLAVSASPIAAKPNDNILQLTWGGAFAATSYIVTVKSASSSYGTEFTTTSLAATLTFPPRIRDQWGNVTNAGPYFSDYSLRIQPMNGTQAGDPVYKVIRYHANHFNVGDY